MNLQAQPNAAALAGRSPRGRLGLALAVSALAHLLVLWPSSAAIVRPRLSATLRHVAPAAAMPAAPPDSLSPIAVAASPVPAPRPILRKPAIAPVPDRLAPARDMAPDRPAAVHADPTDDAIDADGMRSYRMAIAISAQRYRSYPEQAIARGESGTVALRVAVAGNASRGRVDLMRSSGSDALDREARAMLSKAVLATDLPESLRGRTFAFDMPVEYSLPVR